MAIWARRAGVVVLGASTLLFVAALHASAQTPTPTAAKRDCSSFATQEQAQQFFDSTGGKTGPNKDLDVDGDGKACEGLPSAGGTVATPVPVATATPGSNTLPKNGAGTVAMALSGFTFLEAGLGLSLLSRRLGVRRRALPVYLMRKLVRAAREGRNEIELTDDLYLVRRASAAPPTDKAVSDVPIHDVYDPAAPVRSTVGDLDSFAPRPLYGRNGEVTGGRVYAALAWSGNAVTSEPEALIDDENGVITEAHFMAVSPAPEPQRFVVNEPPPAVRVGEETRAAESDPDWPFFTPPS